MFSKVVLILGARVPKCIVFPCARTPDVRQRVARFSYILVIPCARTSDVRQRAARRIYARFSYIFVIPCACTGDVRQRAARRIYARFSNILVIHCARTPDVRQRAVYGLSGVFLDHWRWLKLEIWTYPSWYSIGCARRGCVHVGRIRRARSLKFPQEVLEPLLHDLYLPLLLLPLSTCFPAN